MMSMLTMNNHTYTYTHCSMAVRNCIFSHRKGNLHADTWLRSKVYGCDAKDVAKQQRKPNTCGRSITIRHCLSLWMLLLCADSLHDKFCIAIWQSGSLAMIYCNVELWLNIYSLFVYCTRTLDIEKCNNSQYMQFGGFIWYAIYLIDNSIG